MKPAERHCTPSFHYGASDAPSSDIWCRRRKMRGRCLSQATRACRRVAVNQRGLQPQPTNRETTDFTDDTDTKEIYPCYPCYPWNPWSLSFDSEYRNARRLAAKRRNVVRFGASAICESCRHIRATVARKGPFGATWRNTRFRIGSQRIPSVRQGFRRFSNDFCDEMMQHKFCEPGDASVGWHRGSGEDRSLAEFFRN